MTRFAILRSKSINFLFAFPTLSNGVILVVLTMNAIGDPRPAEPGPDRAYTTLSAGQTPLTICR